MKRKIDHFDELSLSAIGYLERHAGVSEIILQGPVPCPQSAFAEWHEQNTNKTLPEDFRSFLNITNGFYLKWSASIRGKTVPYGCMHVNSLENFRDDGHGNFDLDSNWLGVYFQDVAGHLYFIAESFTGYYRLMMTHLGIPRWQYAYSDIGLDPLTKFWFQFLSPERLKIDDSKDVTEILVKRQRKHAKRAKNSFKKKMLAFEKKKRAAKEARPASGVEEVVEADHSRGRARRASSTRDLDSSPPSKKSSKDSRGSEASEYY